jgi:hypothetical protein
VFLPVRVSERAAWHHAEAEGIVQFGTGRQARIERDRQSHEIGASIGPRPCTIEISLLVILFESLQDRSKMPLHPVNAG